VGENFFLELVASDRLVAAMEARLHVVFVLRGSSAAKASPQLRILLPCPSLKYWQHICTFFPASSNTSTCGMERAAPTTAPDACARRRAISCTHSS
jgi:hypothetical protein